MRVLVTGGVGFVGTNLIKRLLKDGHEVVSIDNYSTGFKENEQEGCEYHNFNLQHIYDFDSYMENPDVVFHLAALARIQPSIKNPTIAIQNNFDSTLNVLEWARKNNTPVVFAGSSSFHHGLWGSPYAWSKHAGEQLCRLYSNVYDLSTIICRFYNVYGPHQLEEGTYATVLGIFEKQYREGKPLTVTGDGQQRRDFTHIEDIVDGLIKCMEAMHGAVDMRYAGEIFELGRGVNFSIKEIAEMFGTEIEYIPKRPGEYDVTLCDYSKANETLDYNPVKNIDEYIKEVIG
ncbi:MAG: NAD-dependent epimerase/dehydratase family protein [bacterium TMED46]|nr:MAG: NAD-dependent epimerase/dehydratase family protein [bacterium TMED46]|tara:strand:+ start:612 stop:1478 length:867 start_codon:yes stop_codon:yes gene_type:complete